MRRMEGLEMQEHDGEYSPADVEHGGAAMTPQPPVVSCLKVNIFPRKLFIIQVCCSVFLPVLDLTICLSIYLTTNATIHIPIVRRSIWPSIHPSIDPSIDTSVSTCIYVFFSIDPSIDTSISTCIYVFFFSDSSLHTYMYVSL